MFKFNNTHIFTGYLKQLLSSVNIPVCKIYTHEFAEYFNNTGKEDPRVVESIDSVFYSKDEIHPNSCINYLKNNELYSYYWPYVHYSTSTDLGHDRIIWKKNSNIFYSSENNVNGLTKILHSPGRFYDTATHEYLGEYLRFLRDYHNINLMSLYNCFNDTVCSNIYYSCDSIINPNFDYDLVLSDDNSICTSTGYTKVFNSQDSKYKIYAIPVKLFADYTIAIDSHKGIEMFCGLYNINLDTTDKNKTDYLFAKTYQKINKTIFNQPFLYDKLNVKNWSYEMELCKVAVPDKQGTKEEIRLNNSIMTRADIINREQDLRLFIKVPTSCKSSIVILEGDYRFFNDNKYVIENESNWSYKQNHLVINFNTNKDKIDLNKTAFTPISKVQLLEFNTGESYPFADRLVEYLSNSAITPIDEIPDNIIRAQRVMKQNNHYFDIEGLWEPKMQKIIYDYIINSGPITVSNNKLIDRHSGHNPKNYGYHTGLGNIKKSTLYDILGYIDKDAEKWYASRASRQLNDKSYKVIIKDTIQNVDIYDNLYDV